MWWGFVFLGGGEGRGGVDAAQGRFLVWQGRPHICVSVLCRHSSCLRSTASALPSSRRRRCARHSSPSTRSAACSISAPATGLPAAPNLFRDRNLAKLTPAEAAQRKLRANCADWSAVHRAAAGSDRPRLLGCCLRAGAVRCVAAACFHDALRPAGATSADAMCSAVWLRWLAQLSSPAIIDAKRVPCRHS